MRIIPTRMGTRKAFDSGISNFQDHPHAYGDKCYTASCQRLSQGSSPRVWGQDLKCFRHDENVRIIPTRMGTRLWSADNGRKIKDHPHAYGDKAETHLYRSKDRGSSPRVWGQDQTALSLCSERRIIPTRMGTRSRYISFYRSSWDHPHAYGDKRNS